MSLIKNTINYLVNVKKKSSHKTIDYNNKYKNKTTYQLIQTKYLWYKKHICKQV